MRTAKYHEKAPRDFEALLQQAVENGLCPDKTDVDSNRVYRVLKGQTKQRYPKSLEPWRAYKKRYPDATPHDLATLKHYTKFLALSMKGRIKLNNPKGMATVFSVRAEIRRFCGMYDRDNAHEGPIPDAVRHSMAPYIEGALADEIGLLRGKAAKLPRKYFTLDCYKKLQAFNWEADWHTYVHEGTRVDATNMINTHCYTSARLAEVCQARYRDLECLVGYYEGNPDIRIKFTREFCKARDFDQPEHPFSERMNAPDGEYPALVAQPIVHWLANIISTDALANYHTLDDILQVKPPKGSTFCTLEWADHVLDLPVFPEWCAKGRTDNTRNPTAWGTQASKLAVRACLTRGLGFHAARRNILINCNDAGYSLGSVLKFAAQRNTNVLVNDYLGTVCAIDGAAVYQGLPARKDLAQDFLSASMKYNPGLKFSLTAQEIRHIESGDDFVAITGNINTLTEKIATSRHLEDISALKIERAALYRERTALSERKLREQQLAQKLEYETEKQPYEETDWHRGHFERMKHMLPPERVRLSVSMTISAAPRSIPWKQSIQDLAHLRSMDCSVAYQDALQPRGGGCPVPECGAQMTSIPAEERWMHVFHCYEKLGRRQYGYAIFCFLCSAWITDAQTWESHCQSHLINGDVPFRYDPIRFRHSIACAGRCPVCIWRTDLPANKKLHQFLDKAVWKRHTSRCIHIFLAEQSDQSRLECPDKRCPIVFSSSEALWDHLLDVHSIPTPTVRDVQNLSKMRPSTSKSSVLQCRFMEVGVAGMQSPQAPLSELMSDSSSDITSSCVSWTRDTIQTPMSDLSDGFTETVVNCTSPDAADIGLALGDLSGMEQLPIDPMLLPSDTGSNDDLSPSSADSQYLVDRLLGRWRYRRTVWFYLRWQDGSHSFEREENISEDLRRDFERRDFTGFHEGAHVKKAVLRGRKVRYLTAFAGCSDEWELPEEALHPELVQSYKTSPKTRRKASGPKKGSRGRRV